MKTKDELDTLEQTRSFLLLNTTTPTTTTQVQLFRQYLMSLKKRIKRNGKIDRYDAYLEWQYSN